MCVWAVQLSLTILTGRSFELWLPLELLNTHRVPWAPLGPRSASSRGEDERKASIIHGSAPLTSPAALAINITQGLEVGVSLKQKSEPVEAPGHPQGEIYYS